MLRYKRLAEEDTVVNRYRTYLLQTIQPDAASVRSCTATLTADGQWPDIPYNNAELANWQVSKHLDRIRDLAIAWAKPASSFYHQEAVWKPMNAALNHWLQKRYQNANWWHNQIGVPQFMRDIITLLRDTLTREQLNSTLAVMDQLKVQQNGAGANLVWSANLGFHYGALTHDWELMQRCRNLLLNEIALTTTEGIQPDHSFHQHGARLQLYQYGQAFLWENVRMAWLLRGTTLAYPEEKLNLLKDLTLKGWQWMARGINTVPGTMDRSVSRMNALQSADIRKLVPYLCDLWPKETQQFKTLEAIQNGRGTLTGYRYYPYSDFAVYHHKDFSFFVKTISTRTLATESINSENLKGHLLHSGDAYIVKSGDEYFNLMPVWDWERLPGVTAFNGAYRIDRQPFVGGVNNGASGLSVMDYRLVDKEQKQSIAARKYWANHGNVVVCLIAGLTAGNTDSIVYTTLDQCRWKGAITVNEPGHIIKEGRHELEQVKWVYHAGVAYIPLQPAQVSLQAQSVTGTWKSINNSLTDAPVTANLFMPAILHGKHVNNLNTGYVLAACPTPQQAQSLVALPTWTVLQNDTSCQAVSFPDGTIMAAFYLPGSLEISANKKLTVNKPCLILIAGKRLYASNPLHKEETLTVQWNEQTSPVQMPDNGFTSNGVLLK
ncbi:chondroitin AC lyase [Niastella vici]|uniref:Chondroitin AC lyase n=2 Tax=Niastella vici TaxID=1703345 RepID=A0A1V9FMQ0_9BACT|nr:chondroitin AC lyase [Niastella vici]